jgi:hypothetical protein
MRDLRNSSSSFVALRYGVDTKQPPLVIDFAREYFRVGGLKTTLTGAVTHTRSSSATMVDSTGTLVTVGSNVPRLGHHIHNGSSWVNEGLLHESKARTNLLLNSGTLSTQSATVAAAPNTLSFTGTGTVTLTGASTAGPLVGTGTGENNRVVLTFTPSAGALTLTVSGTVTNAQLELGSTPSSYIPTTGSTATRAAETLVVAAADMPAYTTVVSVQMDGTMTYADGNDSVEAEFYRWEVNSSNVVRAFLRTNSSNTGQVEFRQVAAGTSDTAASSGTLYSPATNVPFNIAGRHGSTFINGAADGTAFTANNTPVALADLSTNDFKLGLEIMGTIGGFRVWPEDLGDTGIAEASA